MTALMIWNSTSTSVYTNLVSRELVKSLRMVGGLVVRGRLGCLGSAPDSCTGYPGWADA